MNNFTPFALSEAVSEAVSDREVSQPLAIVSSAPRVLDVLPSAPNERNSERNPADVYIASLALGSRRAMEGALDTVARILTSDGYDRRMMPWSVLRYEHTQAIRAALSQRYTPAMTNKCLSALRGTLKAAWRMGQIPTDEYSRAADIPAVRGETLPRGRAIPQGEMRALFRVCADGTLLGVRDAALLAVLYGIGLRRAEVVALDLSDYENATGKLTIRNGKGNKARLGYATNGSQAALEAWLLVRGEEPGPLFVPVLRGGHLVIRRLNNQAVMDVLTRRATQAGVKDVSPHDFRRSFISDLLDGGVDISTVQKLAGHANVSTTTRYDLRGEVAKKKAVETLHVPFVS